MEEQTASPEAMNELMVAPDPVHDDLLRKVNVGAGLVYAIYNHPQGAELIKQFGTTGFTNAYMRACEAYGVGGR